MIIAAADYASGATTTPPPELRLALQCQQYHALPVAGGILDQPAGLMDKLNAVYNTYSAWAEYMRHPYKATWATDNPRAAHIITETVKMRRNG